jgi:monoamine oxidase
MSKQNETTPPVDVLIAGAGMAGLIAGCVLAEAGKSVLLIEASDRVGGRMHSHSLPGIEDPIELGAEFVHGMPPDLLSLIDEAGLHLEEVDGREYCFDGRKLFPCPEDDTSGVVGEMEDYCDQHPDQDMSFVQYLEQGACDETTSREALRFIEGFNAADASNISIQALNFQQKAEDAIQGERAFRIREGYSALADHLFGRFAAAGGRVQFTAQVEKVIWTIQEVRMAGTCEGEALDLPPARRAIIALPLGVLQSNAVDFQPRPKAFEVLDALSMGPVLRLTLVFAERFWDSLQRPYGDMSFLFAENAVPGVFWTRSPSPQPSITAWAGGPSATRMSADAFAQQALQTLARTFGMQESELESGLVSAHLHPWMTDPLSLGAYSYVRSGRLQDSRLWSIPEKDTLYFAGEHTDLSGHWGTVHGAMRSGLRAARQILDTPIGPEEV